VYGNGVDGTYAVGGGAHEGVYGNGGGGGGGGDWEAMQDADPLSLDALLPPPARRRVTPIHIQYDRSAKQVCVAGC
jgi:hypothetical protein